MSIEVQTAIQMSAVDLLWSNPIEDLQVYISASMLSSPKGTGRPVKLPFIELIRPVPDKHFIYYQLGSLPPVKFGLSSKIMLTWTRLDTLLNDKIIIFPYIDNRILPLSKIWLKRDLTNNTFVCLEVDQLKDTYPLEEDLTFRFYTNQWLKTSTGSSRDPVSCATGIIDDDITGSSYITAVTAMKAKTDGDIIAFKNGHYVSDPVMAGVAPGDSVVCYYDPSIKEILDFNLTRPDYFFSDLDADTRKLLLILDNEDRFGPMWNDDIEFFIANTATNSGFDVGSYIPRNLKSDVRNVTLNDFSISTKVISDLVQSRTFLISFQRSTVRLIVREPDRSEFLFKDGMNLHDFHLLPLDIKRRHLLGLETSMPEWTAASLENSPAMRFAFEEKPYRTPAKNVFNFYGNQYYAEQPRKLNANLFRLPPSMIQGGLILHFLADGTLKDVNSLLGANFTQDYSPATDVDQIRVVPGGRVLSGGYLDELSPFNDDPITDFYEERFYQVPGTDNWVYAKQGVDYVVFQGKVNWKSSRLDYLRQKRTVRYYAMREVTVTSDELGAGIDMFEDRSTSFTGLGFGHYYVFLNGRILTEGIDFQVLWPKIHVLSEEYADLVGDNEIKIIGHGAPTFNAPPKIGFVERRKLSAKFGFEPVLYRNKDVVIDGKLMRENDVIFDNGYKLYSSTLTELPAGIREGALYSFDEQTNTLGLVDIETFSKTQKEELDFDERVRKVMYPLYPALDTTGLGPVAIDTKHTVVSIVLKAILDDLLTGKLVITNGGMSDLAVNVKMNAYRHLIDYDISIVAKELTYFEVAAHASATRYDLTVWQNQFLSRVNEIYLNGQCILSDYFNI